MQEFTNPFPIGSSSLIHCMTNEISCEMLANGILALGCKPVMADDPREVLDFTKQSQALFINLGHLSAEKEKAIRMAASYANQSSLPMVVDAVGVTTSSIRKSLVKDLLDYRPTVLKGNMSEIRSLVGLKHHGVGVDASAKDQETEDLLQVLKDWCQTYPGMSFLVTGPKDLIVSENQVAVLENGCTELDWITGTGAIFPTTTKENAPITLISTLKTICQTVAIPIVAIGGLTSENIDQLMGTGIAGVAVVRDLMQAEDIEAKTQAFLTKLHDILS